MPRSEDDHAPYIAIVVSLTLTKQTSTALKPDNARTMTLQARLRQAVASALSNLLTSRKPLQHKINRCKAFKRYQKSSLPPDESDPLSQDERNQQAAEEKEQTKSQENLLPEEMRARTDF